MVFHIVVAHMYETWRIAVKQVAAILLIVVQPTLGVAGKGMASYADGKCFYIGIRNEDLIKTPAWARDAGNPPVSAKKAIAIADATRRSLVNDGKGYKWEVVDARLYQDTVVERWYWQVEFKPDVNQVEPSGVDSNLVLVVLMDGTILKPAISKWKR
jgi:hypothetical protein